MLNDNTIDRKSKALLYCSYIRPNMYDSIIILFTQNCVIYECKETIIIKRVCKHF